MHADNRIELAKWLVKPVFILVAFLWLCWVDRRGG